jgi:tetratricopeptide (TPR) repeat protein
MFKEKIDPINNKETLGDKLMTLDDAQEEANMIKGVLNKTALEKNYDADFKESAENYERGEKFIDEIKEAIKKEPESIKALYKLGRIFHNIGRPLGFTIAMVDSVLNSFVSNLATHGRGYWDYEARQRSKDSKFFTEGLIAPELEDMDEMITKALTDSVKELDNYKKLGNKFMKEEKNKEKRLKKYKELKKEFEPDNKG